jgi:hypothetical protein
MNQEPTTKKKFCIRAVYLDDKYRIPWHKVRHLLWEERGEKPSADETVMILVDNFLNNYLTNEEEKSL